MKHSFHFRFITLQTFTVCSSAYAGDGSSASAANTLLLLILVCGLAAAGFWYLKHREIGPESNEEGPFCEQKITHTFISALPNLTRQMNLEIATTFQTEVFELTDNFTFWGINFGTNRAEIRTPVTYRYHIRLYDAWKLEVRNNAVLVHAPQIRASLPPAIHTDQMQFRSERGWARMSPGPLMENLHRDITPTLCRYAADPHRVSFVRESARISVGEFVRMWLEREDRWNRKAFTAVHVRFPDEATLPASPSVCIPLQT